MGTLGHSESEESSGRIDVLYLTYKTQPGYSRGHRQTAESSPKPLYLDKLYPESTSLKPKHRDMVLGQEEALYK